MVDCDSNPSCVDAREGFFVRYTVGRLKMQNIYEMFNKKRNLETFLTKTLYNFAIVCYNYERSAVCWIPKDKIRQKFSMLSHRLPT
jgi:hypothetical protein